MPIHFQEILDLTKELENKSSLDINDMSVKLLKMAIPKIVHVLEHIFNLSLSNGVFPTGLKISKTVPVFKNSGDKSNMSMYRPISLVNCFSKILEKLMAKRLLSFLENSNFFYKNQFGFIKGRNVNHAVIKTVNYITEALNKDQFVAGIFLDVGRAFDTVNHDILIAKMEKAGIRGTANSWFKSFLTGRKQKVKIGDSWSDNTADIKLGVLQGSILGAILFLVMVNDFYRCTSLLSIIYADDTTLLQGGRDKTELAKFVNNELVKVYDWFCANKLCLNIKKTNCVIFARNEKNVIQFPPLIMANNVINRIDKNSQIPAVRMLGIWLDPQLDFKYYLSTVTKKLNSAIFAMGKTKNILPESSKLLLYFALVHSHLHFASFIIEMGDKKNKETLFKCQKKALRIVANQKHMTHSFKLFNRYNILPLECLCKFNVLKFMCFIKAEVAPTTFNNDSWIPVEYGNYNLRENFNFQTTRIHFSQCEKLSLFSFPKLWNTLPNELKSDVYPKRFIPQVREHLFSNYLNKNICTIRNCMFCV